MQNLIGDFILSVCIGHFVYFRVVSWYFLLPRIVCLLCLVIMESHS